MAATTREEGWSSSLGCLMVDSGKWVSRFGEGRAKVRVIHCICGGLPCVQGTKVGVVVTSGYGSAANGG